MIINDFSMHNQNLAEHQTRMYYEQYYLYSRKLLVLDDLNKLLDAVAGELIDHGFPSAYLVLYEDPKPYKYPDPAPQYSRLIMAYQEKKRIESNESGLRFLTESILPDKIWQDCFTEPGNNFYCIIESLNLDEKQIGYIIFGISGRMNDLTYWLKNVISNALLRILNY